MILAYQEIDVGNMLDASNNIMIDQGIAAFAMTLFALIVFALIGVMLMMLKQMASETKQSNKIIDTLSLTRHDQQETAKIALSQVAATDGVKKELKDGAEKLSESHNKLRTSIETQTDTIKDGISTVNEQSSIVKTNTGSVNAMKNELSKLSSISEALRDTIVNEGVKISTETLELIIAGVAEEMKRKCVECKSENKISESSATQVTPKTEIETKIEKESTDGTKPKNNTFIS